MTSFFCTGVVLGAHVPPSNFARGCILEHLGAQLGLLGRSWTSSRAAWATFWHNFVVMDLTFDEFFEKKLNFRISAPFSNGMGVSGGSRGQVGAVWAPRCSLEAVWTVKTATDRVSRAVGTAKSRQNLAGRFGLAVGAMEIVANGRTSSAT